MDGRKIFKTESIYAIIAFLFSKSEVIWVYLWAIPCVRLPQSLLLVTIILFHVVSPFGLSILFFLFPYFSLNVFCFFFFLYFWSLVYPCTLSTYLWVEFYFVILEVIFLYCLTQSRYYLSQTSFNLFLQVVMSDLSTVLCWCFLSTYACVLFFSLNYCLFLQFLSLSF